MSTISIEFLLSLVSTVFMLPELLSKSPLTVVYSIAYFVAFETVFHSRYAEILPSVRLFLLYTVIPDGATGLVPTAQHI